MLRNGFPDNDGAELSIVIPVYRSAGTLRELVERLLPVVRQLNRNVELILVDDGSPDNSWEVLVELTDKYPGTIVAIQLMRNYGQHNALMCGFRQATGQIIVTMDDDLQNPPEEIPRLIEALEDGLTDAVYGIPRQRQDPGWRKVVSQPIQYFVQMAVGIPSAVSAFRAIRRPVVDAILRYDLNFTFVDGLIVWNTRRITAVTVEHNSRKDGRSGYSLRRLFLHAMNIVTNFSLLPLQAASALGLCASVFGFLVGAYYLIQSLLSRIAVPGYASTIVAVLVLGGLQLLALGIIGEYIGRLHLNVNRKPQYTVRTVLRNNSSNQDAENRCNVAVTRLDNSDNETAKAESLK